MGASEHIKKAITAKAITGKVVSMSLGYSSPQIFYNQLSRDSMKFKDVEKIADLIGCDVVLIDRQTKEIY